jgi:hypothetical protein
MIISRPSTDAGDGSFGGQRLVGVATDDAWSETKRDLESPSSRSARATTAWQAEGEAMIAEFIGTLTLIFVGVGAFPDSRPAWYRILVSPSRRPRRLPRQQSERHYAGIVE